MPNYSTPIVLSDDGLRHVPLVNGSQISPDIIPVADVPTNLLKVGASGLYVEDCNCPPTVSEGCDNLLYTGTDGGARLDVDRIISAGNLDNLLTINNGKLEFSKSTLTRILAELGYVQSGDIPAPTPATCVVDGDKFLKLVNSCLMSGASLSFNTADSDLSLLGIDGSVVSKVHIPNDGGVGTTIEQISITPSSPDDPNGPFLYFKFKAPDGTTSDRYVSLSGIQNVYTAGDGLKLNASNEFSIDWSKVDQHMGVYADIPVYFLIDPTGTVNGTAHTVIPAGYSKAEMKSFQADGPGTSGMTVTMMPEYAATPVLAVTASQFDISAVAGQAVRFKIAGNTTQTVASFYLHLTA